MTANLKFVVETPDGPKYVSGDKLNTLKPVDYLHVWVKKEELDNLLSSDIIPVYNLNAQDGLIVRKTKGNLVKMTMNGSNVGLNDAIFKITTLSGVIDVKGEDLSSISDDVYLNICVPFSLGRLNELLTTDVLLVATDTDDNITKNVSGDQVVGNIPLKNLGALTVDGEQSPLKTSTHTYTAVIDGDVDPSTVLYEWSVRKGTYTNNGSNIEVKWFSAGEELMRCKVSSVDAVDSPVVKYYPVTVTTTEIGSLSMTGPDRPSLFTPVTYEVNNTGDATDVFYVWRTGGVANVINGYNDKTFDVEWTREGVHSVTCTIYSNQSNDSPRTISKNILAGDGLGVGDPTIDGNVTPKLGIDEVYTVNLEGGDTIDNVYSWYCYNGEVISYANSKNAIIRWTDIGAGTVSCLIRSASATYESAVSDTLRVNISKNGIIELNKGYIERVDGRNDPIVLGTELRAEDFSYSNIVSPVYVSYEWYRGSTSVGIGEFYTITEDDIGQSITVKYTVTDQVDTQNVTSDAVIPENYIVSLNPGRISGFPTVNSTVFVSGVSLANGIPPITYSYQWRRVGNPSVISTAPSYTITSAELGEKLECVVTATDSKGIASSATTIPTLEVREAYVFVDAGEVAGNLKVGVEITTTESSAAGGEGPYTFEYKWYSASVDESDVREVGTDRRYTIVLDDDGRKLACQVIVTDANGIVGNDFTEYSKIVSITDLYCNPGTIIGIVKVNETVTTTLPTYSGGTGEVVFSYQWYKDDNTTDVLATTREYLIPQEDMLSVLKCLVTATDSVGVTDSEFTLDSAEVAPLDFEITGIDAITQTETTLSLEDFTYENNLGTGEPIAIYRFTLVNGNTVLQESTSNTYTIESKDRGKTVRIFLELTEPTLDNPVEARRVYSQTDSMEIEFIDFNLTAGTISPETPVAATGTASVVGESIDNDQDVAYRFDWYAENETTAIALNTKTITPHGRDIGKRIRALVTATAGNLIKQEYTPWTNPIAPYTISWSRQGTLTSSNPNRVGYNYSVSSSELTYEYNPITYTYQWQNNSGSVRGSDSKYTNVASDVGKTLRRQITATDPYGISASHWTNYGTTVVNSASTLTAWGDWAQKTNIAYATNARYNLASISGGENTHTHSIDYRYYSNRGQACAAQNGGNVGLSGSVLRGMMLMSNGDGIRVNIGRGQTCSFRIYHSSSGSKTVYHHKSSSSGSISYKRNVKGFRIDLQWKMTDSVTHVKPTYRNKTTGQTASADGYYSNGSWNTAFITNAGSTHTDIEIQNNSTTSGFTIGLRGVYLLTWSDGYTTDASKTPAHNASTLNTHFGTSESDSTIQVEKFTRTTAYNAKIPEGVAYISANETTYTSSGTKTGSKKHCGIPGASVDRGGVCGQIEYYRLGRTNVSLPDSDGYRSQQIHRDGGSEVIDVNSNGGIEENLDSPASNIEDTVTKIISPTD